MKRKPITKAELARLLGVSRTHITYLCPGKRKFSQRLAGKLDALTVTLNPLGGGH